ncbi:MAG: hypothetical protein KAH04_03250 [Psychrilyobacter sp.]|nr:hypothetical protein [Psychrilyobacter sp.]
MRVKRNMYLIGIFIILNSLVFSSDINITLSEKAINSFVTAASPVEFSQEINVLTGKTKADFTITKVNIDLEKDKISIKGHLNIDLNGSTLDANISGELEPTIDEKTGELSLKLSKVDIKGLEFLKLDKALKNNVSIPLKVNELKAIEIKKSDTEYLEVNPIISNQKILIIKDKISIIGDIRFEKGQIKKYD